MKKILIIGGHSTPAFAVLDELIKNKNLSFVWVGQKYNQKGNKNPSQEYTTVTRNYKIDFINLNSGKLVRKWSFSTFFYGIIQLLRIILGSINAFFIILKIRPSLVLSFGGFLAVPVTFWAYILGIKVITHEQTLVSGFANKVISRFATKILVSWKSNLNDFPEEKVIFTGNPIRKDIFKVHSNLLKSFNTDLPIVYITGGNQGANLINISVFKIIHDLLQIANVVHQTGNSTITNDFNKALQIKDNLATKLKNRYIVKQYINKDQIGEVFNKSSIVLSRAGANTMSEILALKKLCILIPIPWTSGNEQNKNADVVRDTGLGLVIKQNELNSKVLYENILHGLDRANKNLDFKNENISKNNSLNLINLDAALDISKIVQDTLFLPK